MPGIATQLCTRNSIDQQSRVCQACSQLHSYVWAMVQYHSVLDSSQLQVCDCIL